MTLHSNSSKNQLFLKNLFKLEETLEHFKLEQIF